MKTKNDVTILFVDDEPDLLAALQRFLRRETCQNLFASSGKEALEILEKTHVDIIISDLHMPEMNGLELLAKVKKCYPAIIRLILSATREVEQAIEAINKGEVYRFISKPLRPDQFKLTIRDVIDYHLLIRENKEMMTGIEKRLLQEFPVKNLPGAKIASLMISAGDLSGDFTDYYYYSDKKLDILVGDVMGKGVQSSLVAASIKQKFAKTLAICNSGLGYCEKTCFPKIQDQADLSQVVSNVHACCIKSLLDLEIFATLDYARIDLEAGKMSLVDCGHPPVIHYQKQKGKCTYHKCSNMPLGMIAEQDYEVLTVDLNSGDVVLFYSDGIIEAESSSGDLYGTERLVSKVEECWELSPESLIEAIREDVDRFSKSETFPDDLTCVALKLDE
jgi:phosphoserine phosphatase RsbU/P